MNCKSIRLVISLLALMSLLLSACGGAATEAPPAEVPTTEAPAPAEKAKVVIFIGMGTGTDPDQIAAQEALQEEFNSTHDDIEVEFLIVPHEEAGERYLAWPAAMRPNWSAPMASPPSPSSTTPGPTSLPTSRPKNLT